jgi:hypothetical protein
VAFLDAMAASIPTYTCTVRSRIPRHQHRPNYYQSDCALPLWRAGMVTAAPDPYRGYTSALRAASPDVVRVLDAFHVRLAFALVTRLSGVKPFWTQLCVTAQTW